ncbi:U-box domain-containing protein 44 [Nicotiana tabacum]|uniref:U-box domain-containing protein 44 n=4 Tax=Nicotiana TaxID=4085 RepID=A0AC58UR66_TOBAC|nr:PREDICTED: U-box domain-containing protein 44-like [Nicotiana sylvestris]XP_009801975.1 PREDICTED: U-box domain-containing protein 44-like [Nicotiana sylvestris]
MPEDPSTDVSHVQASGFVTEIIRLVYETIDAANSVVVQKENFDKFSNFLEKIALVLKELSKSGTSKISNLSPVFEDLKLEIELIKQLALDCRNRNKIYLLLNCQRIVKFFESSTRDITQTLLLMTSEPLNVLPEIADQLRDLCEKMLDTKYDVSTKEEEVSVKIESGIQERNVDRSYANDLLICIAKAVGIANEQSQLKKEFEEFKRGTASSEQGKNLAETLRMEEIILLLGKADLLTTAEEKQTNYLTKRNSLGRQPLEPLQSFYCPITGDVMEDPVETSSGQIFERAAIEKWLADGNKLCPLTKNPLKRSDLRSNKTLRQSIEEWKNRNIMVTIASLKQKIQANDEEEVLQSLQKLLEFCVRSELQREWIVMENYIPVTIDLLSANNTEIRKSALMILYALSKDSEEGKERIGTVDNAIGLVVRSLARKPEESTLALQLLLELSRSSIVRDLMGSVQGCILLLVTFMNSDDSVVANHASEILKNLSFLDQNVIEMARLNYGEPLLQHLCSGTESKRMSMAKTLSEIELSDQIKLCLIEKGALKPLLELLSHSNTEMKSIAVKALQSLSTVTQNGQLMVKEGVSDLLFELLFCHTLSNEIREHVAATIMQLAMSTNSQRSEDVQVSLLESLDDIFKLFSLVSLTGSNVQQSILRIFQAMCQSPAGSDIRTKLRQISAIKVLVYLCELDDRKVRADAVKLFYLLAKDGNDDTLLEHVNSTCIGNLVQIIRTSDNEEETAAALGIISYLPQDCSMSQHLLDAGALDVILDCLRGRNEHALPRNEVVENAAGALCHFTLPTNPETQKQVAEAGFITLLVSLLGSGSSLTKKNAATCLKQLSESSCILSKPARKNWMLSCCIASPTHGCPVHLGICSVESTFCLVEANALRPLAEVLDEPDPAASEASLDAILTIIEGAQLQNGSKLLAEANAIAPIIKLLSSSSIVLQEKALKALERIFRMIEMKQKYGISAQMPLVEITQKGRNDMKSLAAKVLAHLNVLPEQSSFF